MQNAPNSFRHRRRIVGAVLVASLLALLTHAAAPKQTPSSLSKARAEQLVQELWAIKARALYPELETELRTAKIKLGDHALRLLVKKFGDEPTDGHSLWISLHGGGGTTPDVNTRQWQNQIKLYEPKEGIYVAPRGPTDTWNLWHQEHVDPLLDRLIAAYVVARGVNPNRVYLMGYSAGGDGVYQLAPRMADRFAAAAMMAGHPNDARPEGLRNLPFMIFMGGDDAAYDRNKVAKAWGQRLDKLHEFDPGGYTHPVTIYDGLGHWMEGRDKSALPWMAQYTRQPWPKRVVWRQDDVLGERFYWLQLDRADARAGTQIIAEVDGQTITLKSDDIHHITLRLRDTLLDLDQPITVTANDHQIFNGRAARTKAAIEGSLNARPDPVTAATAVLDLAW